MSLIVLIIIDVKRVTISTSSTYVFIQALITMGTALLPWYINSQPILITWFLTLHWLHILFINHKYHFTISNSI